MKKLISTLVLATVVLLGATTVSAKQDHKVTICHATSSTTNPYVRIVVDEHATAGHFDNNGTPESGHEDDILLDGEQDCPGPVTPPPPPPCTTNCPPPPCTTNCTPPPCTMNCTPPPTPCTVNCNTGGDSSGGHHHHSSGSKVPTPSLTADFVGLQMPEQPQQVLGVSTSETLPRTGMGLGGLYMIFGIVGLLFSPLLFKKGKHA